MRAVGGQQELQLVTREEPLQPITNGQIEVAVEALRLAFSKVTEETKKIELPDEAEKPVERVAFQGKEALQHVKVRLVVRRDGEARAIRQMELIHRVHLDPLGLDAEIAEQLSRNAGRVTQEWIEMASCVKDKPLPAKCAAIATDHVMLLD
jgi:hypothetical protein